MEILGLEIKIGFISLESTFNGAVEETSFSNNGDNANKGTVLVIVSLDLQTE